MAKEKLLKWSKIYQRPWKFIGTKIVPLAILYPGSSTLYITSFNLIIYRGLRQVPDNSIFLIFASIFIT